MKSFCCCSALIVVVVSLLLSIVDVVDAVHVITVALSGDQEVPAVDSPVTGAATFIYSAGTDSILWSLDITNMEGLGIWGAAGAHLHCGIPGETGDVIVPLFPGGMPDTSAGIGATGTIDIASISSPGACFIETISDLWATLNTGGVYINVHSNENPSGEIRGDIMEGVLDDAKLITVSMTGDAEVPPVMTTLVSGIVTLAYSEFAEKIIYSLTIDNPDGIPMYGAAGAHLHCGGVGVNGGVIVSLVEGGTSDSSLSIAVTGELATVDVKAGVCEGVVDIPTLYRAMVDTADGIGIYANVHSEINLTPGGEIRGDIGVPVGSVPPVTNATSAPSSIGSSTPSSSSSSPSSAGTEQPTATPIMMMPSPMMTTEAPGTTITDSPTSTPTSLTTETFTRMPTSITMTPTTMMPATMMPATMMPATMMPATMMPSFMTTMTKAPNSMGASSVPTVAPVLVTVPTMMPVMMPPSPPPDMGSPGGADVISVLLSGDQEVPPVVDSSAMGTATFIYCSGTNSIIFTLDIMNDAGLGIWGAAGAHLHCGGPGQTGDVLVSLVDSGTMPDTSAEIGLTGTIDTGSIVMMAGAACGGGGGGGGGIQTIPELWMAMQAGEIYINVHSTENPSGEIRGDIMEGIMEDAQYLIVPLTGDAEVPPVMTSVTGTMMMAYSAFAETIVYSMNLENPNEINLFSDAGAHIHCGGVGMTGGVVVDLVLGGSSWTQPDLSFTQQITEYNFIPGVCDGVTDIKSLWMAMMDGSRLYVNVHSENNPGGEVRGDIGVVAVVDPMSPSIPLDMEDMP